MKPSIIIAALIILWSSFAINILGVETRNKFMMFQIDSEALILGKIGLIAAAPFEMASLVAAPCRPSAEDRMTASLMARETFLKFDCGAHYTGNPAIQAIPLGMIASAGLWADLQPATILLMLKLLSSLLAALAATWIAVSVARRHGTAAGVGSVLGFILVPQFVSMGPNLYWFPALALLPAAIVMDRASRGLRLTTPILCAFALAVALEMLTGFEHVTNVLLGAGIGWMALTRHRRSMVAATRDLVTPSVRLAAAGIAGLAFGVLAHLAMLAPANGSFGAACSDMTRRILYRTLSAPEGANPAFAKSLEVPKLDVLWTYLSAGSIYPGYSLAALVGAAVLISMLTRARIGQDAFPLWKPLGLIMGATTASMSWHVLATGHSVIHTHINHALTAMPATPVLMGLIAFCAFRLLANLKLRTRKGATA